jgi:hypothetical protein
MFNKERDIPHHLANISIALAIHNAGGVALTRDQLAGVMNTTAGNGTLLLRQPPLESLD